jgi:predicted Zn finger-like uncharacterized protein
MSATMNLSCPKCKTQIKAPAEARGKKVKCKGCGEIFTAVDAAPAKAAPAKKAKPQAPAKRVYEEDEEGKNPYDVTDLDLAARCPHCAGEMESADAIICLHCGYNTQTRQKAETIKVYKNTFGDWFVHLAPPILAALVAIGLLGVPFYFWLPYANVTSLPHLPLEYGQTVTISTESESKEKEKWFPLRVWGSVIAAGVSFILGRLAFKRLVFNPAPPPKLKKK